MHRPPRSPAWYSLAGLSATHPSPEPRAVVLVVDDDAGVREALHLVLDEEYSVLDAAHGRTALAIVAAERVDLVLLDILMPEVDGIEILQELKALDPELPVVMMTGVKTVLTSVAAMKLGASDYITKPFHEEHLIAAIHRALEQRANRPPATALSVRQDRVGRLPRTHRLLVVGGALGWRATLAVALARCSAIETSPSLVEGLDRVLRFKPTGVVLDVGPSSAETAPFLRAVQAQLPACPVLVISDDGYLGGSPERWEILNIRGVMRPPIALGELVSRIGIMLCSGGDADGAWPRLGASVSQAMHCISARFNERLSLESLAQAADISTSHFAHLFRAEIGMSVGNYLTRVRVAIAQDLLASTDDKLEIIAACVGFYDMFHLSRVFHRVTGKSPSAYRQSVG